MGWGCLSWTSLLRRLLSPWDALGVLVKGQLAASKDFISGICFCLLSQCAVLYWSLEIWKCEIALAILGPLWFRLNF